MFYFFYFIIYIINNVLIAVFKFYYLCILWFDYVALLNLFLIYKVKEVSSSESADDTSWIYVSMIFYVLCKLLLIVIPSLQGSQDHSIRCRWPLNRYARFHLQSTFCNLDKCHANPSHVVLAGCYCLHPNRCFLLQMPVR